MTKRMLDDEQRVRYIDDTELESPCYCEHGLELDEYCADCEWQSKYDTDDTPIISV